MSTSAVADAIAPIDLIDVFFMCVCLWTPQPFKRRARSGVAKGNAPSTPRRKGSCKGDKKKFRKPETMLSPENIEEDGATET
jgi:hypothetical protein